jgi:hypothetical protein
MHKCWLGLVGSILNSGCVVSNALRFSRDQRSTFRGRNEAKAFLYHDGRSNSLHDRLFASRKLVFYSSFHSFNTGFLGYAENDRISN